MKIKNTHKPIEEILKQNEIDMANRPKKMKKQPEEGEDEIAQQIKPKKSKSKRQCL